MDDVLEGLLGGVELRPGACVDLINGLEASLGVKFPADYREFLLRSNGASGFVGKSYLLIWPLENIEEINEIASAGEFAPGLILFGSDGGDMSYAFDTRNSSLTFAEVPSIGMSLKEVASRGATFRDFLEYLASS